MPTSLEFYRSKLTHRISVADSAFERMVVGSNLARRVDRSAHQEGLISFLWQAWCAFCRDITVNSASGTQTVSGGLVSSPYAGHSDAEIAYVARKLIRKENIGPIKALPSHLEPTWGDPNQVVIAANGLGLTNAAALSSAFGLALQVNDLRLCRNTCAHLNKQTLQEITLAKVKYSNTDFRHPSDMIFWVDPATKDFLWRSWIDEIDIVSSLAIE